jgi:hypothetical protein
LGRLWRYTACAAADCGMATGKDAGGGKSQRVTSAIAARTTRTCCRPASPPSSLNSLYTVPCKLSMYLDSTEFWASLRKLATVVATLLSLRLSTASLILPSSACTRSAPTRRSLVMMSGRGSMVA